MQLPWTCLTFPGSALSHTSTQRSHVEEREFPYSANKECTFRGVSSLARPETSSTAMLSVVLRRRICSVYSTSRALIFAWTITRIAADSLICIRRQVAKDCASHSDLFAKSVRRTHQPHIPSICSIHRHEASFALRSNLLQRSQSRY